MRRGPEHMTNFSDYYALISSAIFTERTVLVVCHRVPGWRHIHPRHKVPVKTQKASAPQAPLSRWGPGQACSSARGARGRGHASRISEFKRSQSPVLVHRLQVLLCKYPPRSTPTATTS